MTSDYPVEHWESDEACVRVCPERGRLLGIRLNDEEALWAPDHVTEAWCLGGERLWLGPEADWHWQRLGEPDFDYYEVAPSFSPDIWRVEASEEGFFQASLNVSLRSAHREARLELRLRKSLRMLRPELLAPGLQGIALRAETSLEILDGIRGQPVDLWSLIQIPFGGQIIVPTMDQPRPRDHFAPCPASEYAVDGRQLRIRIGGSSPFKLGLPALQSVGRVAYERPVNGGILVFARFFPLLPFAYYCDAPMADPGSQGDVLQFFNDGGEQGCFGEIEHRSHAIRCGIGPQSLHETTDTLVALLSPEAAAQWRAAW